MNVRDFITKLAAFAAQSPENAAAEVMLQQFDGVLYGILGANDAKGMPGQHALILVPDSNIRVLLKEFKIQ